MGEVVRRRDQRWKFILPGVFVAIALFTFLSQNFKSLDEEADAASLANFDPGYIISDYQMGNYNSMNEAEIQAFLKSKNSCNDTNLSRYTYGNKVDYYSETTPYTWHVDSGHFVCMADEVINGETAAHIIWQAAQDFRINPQVLIVVLQKEQAIVTDTFPHSIQYRSAMGYGCPDTAPCSPSYAGFRNQVRNAAEMFRTVLDGGWTNYPVGDNYIQYNPNASCGGSVVNIKNRATSALYRYTPYQPNAGALAAGYGTAYCGAYGNRNFYLYFEDWFGGARSESFLLGEYGSMIKPRLFYVKYGSRYIEPQGGERKVRSGSSFEYFTSMNFDQNGNMCLALFENRNCYLYSDLEEISFDGVDDLSVPRMLMIKEKTKKLNIIENNFGDDVVVGESMIFRYKTYVNGRLCLFESKDSNCVLYSFLEELPIPVFSLMVVPRDLYIEKNAYLIDVETGIQSVVGVENKLYFNKSTHWKNNLCLGSDALGVNKCILYDMLGEVARFDKMARSRYLLIQGGSSYYDTISNDYHADIIEEKSDYFVDKTYIDGKLCLRTERDAQGDIDRCVFYSDLIEE